MSDAKTVTVSILDKDYQVSCQANEVVALQRSAEYLDKKMREMRENSNVFGIDRVAVMAALNLTNELLAESEKASALGSQQVKMTHKIAKQNAEIEILTNKVDSALDRLKRNHS